MKEGTHGGDDEDTMPFGGGGGPGGGGGEGDAASKRRRRSSDASDSSDDYDSDSSMVRKVSSPRSSNQGDIRTMFRPFNMNAMDNVRYSLPTILQFKCSPLSLTWSYLS